MHDRMDPCVQSQHLPMMCPQVSRKYQVALASTLNPDGAPGSEKYDSVSPGPHSPCASRLSTARLEVCRRVT